MMAARPSGVGASLRAVAPPALVGAAASVLLRFPPEQSGFYPQCPIYSILHVQCPGCGSTRAVAALLHGQLREAIHFNALITLILPLAVIYGVACYLRFIRLGDLRLPQPPPAAIYTGLTVAVIFSIVRNLPLRW